MLKEVRCVQLLSEGWAMARRSAVRETLWRDMVASVGDEAENNVRAELGKEPELNVRRKGEMIRSCEITKKAKLYLDRPGEAHRRPRRGG